MANVKPLCRRVSFRHNSMPVMSFWWRGLVITQKTTLNPDHAHHITGNEMGTCLTFKLNMGNEPGF